MDKMDNDYYNKLNVVTSLMNCTSDKEEVCFKCPFWANEDCRKSLMKSALSVFLKDAKNDIEVGLKTLELFKIMAKTKPYIDQEKMPKDLKDFWFSTSEKD